jgi:hypothetical protein
MRKHASAFHGTEVETARVSSETQVLYTVWNVVILQTQWAACVSTWKCIITMLDNANGLAASDSHDGLCWAASCRHRPQAIASQLVTLESASISLASGSRPWLRNHSQEDVWSFYKLFVNFASDIGGEFLYLWYIHQLHMRIMTQNELSMAKPLHEPLLELREPSTQQSPESEYWKLNQRLSLEPRSQPSNKIVFWICVSEILTNSHFCWRIQAFHVSVLELSVVSPVVGDIQRYFTWLSDHSAIRQNGHILILIPRKILIHWFIHRDTTCLSSCANWSYGYVRGIPFAAVEFCAPKNCCRSREDCVECDIHTYTCIHANHADHLM